jgi:hypothetical protein
MNDEEMLLAFVHERDAECPACGYNVRSLVSPRCPECGRELRLTIGTLEPYLKPWITLVVVLCAAAGLGLFCFLMLLKDGWPRLGNGRQLGFNMAFLFHMLTMPIAVLAVLTRRRFMRLSRTTQWRLTTLVAIVCGGMFLLFILLVR